MTILVCPVLAKYLRSTDLIKIPYRVNLQALTQLYYTLAMPFKQVQDILKINKLQI